MSQGLTIKFYGSIVKEDVLYVVIHKSIWTLIVRDFNILRVLYETFENFIYFVARVKFETGPKLKYIKVLKHFVKH